jgi:hypothetical protein
MHIAFGCSEVLNAGNRAFHFHHDTPIVHNRGGFPPVVIAVLSKTLISGGVGYAFLALRRREWCGSRTNLFAQLRTDSEKLDDLCDRKTIYQALELSE